MPSRRGHNEGTIYRRPGRLRADGTRGETLWVGQVTLETATGPQRKTFYGKTKRDVQVRMDAARTASREGNMSAVTRETLAEFLSGWLATVKSSIRVTTYVSYDLNVRRVTKYLGGMRLSAIKPADIQHWYAQLTNDGLSAHSVTQARRVLHIALDDAVDWELIPRNPIDATKAPRIEHREREWFRKDEALTLFRQTRGDHLHALWVVLGTAGLRIGEALGLTWSDVDLDAQMLTIHRAIQRQPGRGLVFVEPKTERSRRTIHLTRLATGALIEHERRQHHQRELLGHEWQENGLVFCTALGAPLDGTNVSRVLERTLATHGLKKIGLHGLRHSAASLMIAEGIPLKVVQEILGHSSYTLTANTYSHIAPELQRDAADRLDSALRSTSDHELD
jgi:integrase